MSDADRAVGGDRRAADPLAERDEGERDAECDRQREAEERRQPLAVDVARVDREGRRRGEDRRGDDRRREDSHVAAAGRERGERARLLGAAPAEVNGRAQVEREEDQRPDCHGRHGLLPFDGSAQESGDLFVSRGRRARGRPSCLYAPRAP